MMRVSAPLLDEIKSQLLLKAILAGIEKSVSLREFVPGQFDDS